MSTNTFLCEKYQGSYEQKHNFMLDAILQKINNFLFNFFGTQYFSVKLVQKQ